MPGAVIEAIIDAKIVDLSHQVGMPQSPNLVEHGINIVETMNLTGLRALGIAEFVFVLNPLRLVGATGGPVRPLALVKERA